MGKKDSFNVGDLVFAKVKGYPAWPAKIVDITKSKKYSVYFYGTGESANVQGKDITLYVNAKQKLATSSSMKKPNFSLAIEQIEAALGGDDPVPNSYEIPLDNSNATLDSTANVTLGTLSELDKIDESLIGQDNDEAEESDGKEDISESVQENESIYEPAVEEKVETAKPEITVINEPETNSTVAVKEVQNTEVKSANSEVKPEPKVEIKSEQKAEDKTLSRSGRVIKKTKYLHDEIEDSHQIPMKRKRPSETQTPNAKVARKVDDSNTADDGEIEMKQVSQIILNEVNLLQYDVDIKSSLQLTSADTSRCIAVLEKYKTLEVTALMLKKNPQVAETIKRLRRYVGNAKEWNFTDEQRCDFNDKAAKIRKLAETIYKNFKKLFTFPSSVSFWQGFTDELESFKEQTKSLSHEQLIKLTEDVQPAVNQSIEVKNSIRV